MKKFLILIFFPLNSWGQEVKVVVDSETSNSDGSVSQILSFSIFNNFLDPLCIRISSDFLAYKLNKDTVPLFRFDGNGCYNYNLLCIKNGNSPPSEFPQQYPLILQGLSSFVVKLKVDRKLNCSDRWIEFWYYDLSDSDVNVIRQKYLKGQTWDSDPSLKYKIKKTFF